MFSICSVPRILTIVKCFFKKLSECATCSWLHCFLIEHVENTENMGNMERNGPLF
jgi:hypothetical protein